MRNSKPLVPSDTHGQFAELVPGSEHDQSCVGSGEVFQTQAQVVLLADQITCVEHDDCPVGIVH